MTAHLKQMAVQQGIPLVQVRETIQPPNVSFQGCQVAQFLELQNALNAQVLGQYRESKATSMSQAAAVSIQSSYLSCL